MNTSLLRFLLAALSSLLLAACHHADPDPGGCQFAYGYDSSNDFTYTFNAAGQPIAARATGSILGEFYYNYTYTGSQVTLPVTYGQGSIWNYWELTLNTQGYLTRAVNTFRNASSQQVKQLVIFGYDADGHLIGYHSDGYMLGQATTPNSSMRLRLDYQNGDLIQMFDSLSHNLLQLEYGPQANRMRVPMLLESLSSFQLDPGLLPFLGKPTNHLLKRLHLVQSISPDTISHTYTYTLDGNGLPTKVVVSYGSTIMFSNTCP